MPTVHENIGTLASVQSDQIRMLFSYWDGGRCHLNRTMAVAAEAMSSGIECGFITSEKFAPYIGRLITQENIYVIPNRPPHAPPPYDLPLYSHAYGHGQRLRGLGFADEAWVAKTTEREIAAIQSFRPNVIVNDYRDTIRTSAEVVGVPIIGITHTTGNTDGLRFGWWTPLPTHTKVPNCTDSFNAVRAEYGLAPFTDERYMFTGDVSIIPSSPSIDPLIQHTHPSHYVGKIAQPRPDDGSFKPMRPEIAGHRVFSYVGEASRPQYGYQGMLTDVIEAMPNTGFYIDGDAEDYSQARIGNRLAEGSVVINRVLPGPRVIADSSVVLCHGGHGTIMQSLTQGVPIICVGPYQTDSTSNMRRLTELGAGLVVNHSEGSFVEMPAPDLGEGVSIFGYWQTEITGNKIRDALETVLNDPSYAENARILGEEIVALGGMKAAVAVCRSVAKGGV